MSVENVEKFYTEAVQSNVQLKEQLNGAETPDSFVQQTVQLGQENGYTFTSKDVVAFLSQKKTEASSGLSDQDLEAVAGGKGGSCPFGTKLTTCFTVSGCWESVC